VYKNKKERKTSIVYNLPSQKPCFQPEVQIIASTLVDNRTFIYLLRILELMLNVDSDATVVIGMLSKSLTIKARFGKCPLLFFQHSRTSIGTKK